MISKKAVAIPSLTGALLVLLSTYCVGVHAQENAGNPDVLWESSVGPITQLDMHSFQLLGKNCHLRQIRLRGRESNIEAKLIASDRVLAEERKQSPESQTEIGRVKRLAPYIIGSYVVQELLADFVEIRDEDVRKKYEENIHMYKEPARATVYHLFVETPPESDVATVAKAEKKIAEALAEYEQSGDFAEVCMKHSEDKMSAPDYIIERIPEGKIEPSLDEAIFSLKEGEVSSIVKTKTGFHVFKLVGKDDEVVTPFEEVKEAIERHLRKQKGFEKWEEMCAKASLEPLYEMANEISLATSEADFELNGENFAKEDILLLNVVLAGETVFLKKLSTKALKRLNECMFAYQDDLYRQLLNTPLYENTVEMVTNWYLGWQLCQAEVESRGDPTEEQLKRFYDELLNAYLSNPSRKCSMIFIPAAQETDPAKKHYAFQKAYETAEKVVQELQNGGDFAQLAKEYSKAPSAANGGYMGWLEEPSFYEADTTLEKMKSGEVSAPVKSNQGYYIFQLHEVKEAEPLPFEEVRDSVRADLVLFRELETWDGKLLDAQKNLQLKKAE